MKNYVIKGREVTFVIEVTDAGDAVTGAWGGNAYGTVVYPKATATNPMYQFEPVSIAVQAAGDGIVDFGNNFTLVQNRNTGFVGVKGTGITVGSKIVVMGFFVLDPTTAGATPKIEYTEYVPPRTNSKNGGVTVN